MSKKNMKNKKVNQPVERKLTQEEKALVEKRDKALKKMVDIFNKEEYSTNDIKRLLQVFDSNIKAEFNNYKSKLNVSKLGIQVIMPKKPTETDLFYAKVLKILTPLSIPAAESVLSEVLNAIEITNRKHEMETKFKDLNIKAEKEDEQN